jgi:hypothetical protein
MTKKAAILGMAGTEAWRVAVAVGTTGSYVRWVRCEMSRKEASEQRRAFVIAMSHLTVARIIEITGWPDNTIREYLKCSGLRVTVDRAEKSRRLSEAYARGRSVRVLASKKGAEKSREAKARLMDDDRQTLTPAATITPSKLEYARRILGATGRIEAAAAAVGMAPERLQRHINHMR